MGSSAASWSAPATLSTCLGAGAPRATFPRNSPTHATGPGAIVWSSTSGCAQGAGTFVSAIGRGDTPGRPAFLRAPGGRKVSLRPPLALAPAPHGQIVIAGSGGENSLVQGSARGTFTPLGTIAGASESGTLATGYLGDVGAIWPAGDGVQARIERYFANRLSAPMTAAGGGGPVQTPTISLDFRTDAIAVWQQAGAIYARDLPASGQLHRTQKLAASGPHPKITALISDDNRAIVAWADDRDGKTSVYLDDSATGVRFAAPHLLERFADPGGLAYPGGSPRLIRLSSESVMLAWTGAERGHWVVRSAAIDLNGLRGGSTVSAPEDDALLSDLEPGPDGEAIAVWGEPQPNAAGRLDLGRQAIYAARGIDASPGKTIFGNPELLAPAGANSEATLAFDPASDRAIALWRGAGSSLEYAIRTPPSP
jgi:hypothetical protein